VKWIVFTEDEVNDPDDPDLLANCVEAGRFNSRDEANALAIRLSRNKGNITTTVANADRPSSLTGQPFTLVGVYVNGKRG
jgi:hypothetical protein